MTHRDYALPIHALRFVEQEHGVTGRDGEQLLVGRGGADPVEEHAELRLPSFEVGPQDLHLVGVSDLGGDAVLALTTEKEIELAARSPHVADPLTLAPPRCTRRLGHRRSPVVWTRLRTLVADERYLR